MPMLIQKAKIRRITRSFRFTVVFKKPFHDVHTLHTKWLYILLICKLISSWHYKSIFQRRLTHKQSLLTLDQSCGRLCLNLLHKNANKAIGYLRMPSLGGRHHL